MEEHRTSLPDSVLLPFEAHQHSITPLFKHLAPLNVALSEEAGRAVYDPIIEVVELRFAGDRNYAPVFPADAMAYKVGTRTITYAERFADQYRQFLQGDTQMAGGTALEALADYGMTPALLSLCRALKIYSIEALHSLEGAGVHSLGMNANRLKEMARRWIEDHTKRSISKNEDDIEALKAEVERLKALQATIPTAQTPPDEIGRLVSEADTEYANLTDAELKTFIKDRTGAAPRGNPSRETLLSMVRDVA